MSPTIGILSGTGPAGLGLAARLAAGGASVRVGSRDHARSQALAEELTDSWGSRRMELLDGVANSVAAEADLIVIGTKAEHTLELAREHQASLTGKIVVSLAARMSKASRGLVAEAASGDAPSVAVALQTDLPETRVVAGFHHLPGKALVDPEVELDTDVLLCSDDADAVAEVAATFSEVTSGRFFDAGVLANAVALESMTAALVTVNILNKTRASIRLVDTRKDRANT